MTWTHTFGTFSSTDELSQQELVLAEDYEQHREAIEGARDVIATVVDRGLAGTLGDGDAYSAYASASDSQGGVSGFSLSVNTVPAPKPGPDAPADQVAQPGAPVDEPEQPAEQTAAVAGGGETADTDGAADPLATSGSEGNATPSETLGGGDSA